jgi:hypothetical protein
MSKNTRDCKLVPQLKPLTPELPLGTSPLDDARNEIARLKQLTPTRILDLELREKAMRKFIVAAGLWAEFQKQNTTL